MSGTISFNPFGTSTPQNTFLSPTQGYIQGCVYDDPTARMELMGGVLASTESVVMWGGRPITEFVNVTTAGSSDGLGPTIATATSQALMTGWTVWAASMVLIPGGAYPPVAAVGNFIGFYRYGSNARIAVAADPALITALTSSDTSIVGTVLTWDTANYRITNVAADGTHLALPTSTKLISTNSTNSKIVTYANSQASWSTGSAAIIQI